jgi:hypothetical protein
VRRNCAIAVILWIALAGGYAYLLRERLPMPALAIASLIAGSVVWLGLVWIHGARYELRDWRARKRMISGERPQDGDLVTATGTIHPTFEPLQAPLSGRPCVLYSYQINARDYLGFGMTRCAVRTPYGDLLLGSFPVMHGLGGETLADLAAAEAFVAAARFEPLDGVTAMLKRMLQLHTEAPPLRRDWKMGDRGEIFHADETIVAPGELVTATGRFVSASNTIVSDTNEKGYLRLVRGSAPRQVESVAWGAIRSAIGGIITVVVANAILWFVLERMPR